MHGTDKSPARTLCTVQGRSHFSAFWEGGVGGQKAKVVWSAGGGDEGAGSDCR